MEYIALSRSLLPLVPCRLALCRFFQRRDMEEHLTVLGDDKAEAALVVPAFEDAFVIFIVHGMHLSIKWFRSSAHSAGFSAGRSASPDTNRI